VINYLTLRIDKMFHRFLFDIQRCHCNENFREHNMNHYNREDFHLNIDLTKFYESIQRKIIGIYEQNFHHIDSLRRMDELIQDR